MQLEEDPMSARQGSLHNGCMLGVHAIKAQDLKALSAAELAAFATQMLAHISEQSRHVGEQDKRIDSQVQAIKWRDAKIESITFQLARLKAWKFGAKTEAMNAEQRDLFEETLAADQASLEAQLAALQAPVAKGVSAPDKQPRRQPKREPLPAHLPRVDQRIEPEDTRCPTPECGQPMVRVGEDISERLDIVPAQFFVQRQIRGYSGGGAPAPDVGLQVLPAAGAGTGRAPGLRQRAANAGPAGPHGHQPLRRSHSVLPAGADQRTLWGAHAALDLGRLRRADGGATDAAVRRAPGVRSGLARRPRRRDADRSARPRRG